jgi:hypothetical protein
LPVFEKTTGGTLQKPDFGKKLQMHIFLAMPLGTFPPFSPDPDRPILGKFCPKSMKIYLAGRLRLMQTNFLALFCRFLPKSPFFFSLFFEKILRGGAFSPLPPFFATPAGGNSAAASFGPDRPRTAHFGLPKSKKCRKWE